MPTRDRADIRLLPVTPRRTSATGDRYAMHAHPHLALVPTGARFGADRPRPMTVRRASGSAASKEPTTMYAAHQGPNLNYLHAVARREEMLAQAEQIRRVAQAERAARRRSPVAAAVAALRLGVGIALVRVGQRVQGAGGRAAADTLPSIATLRAAR